MAAITRKWLESFIEVAYSLEVVLSAEVDDGAEVPRPKLRPPATAKELAAFERWLGDRGLALPPSFRAFLSLANGIEHFRPSPFDGMSLLGTKELVTPPHKSQLRIFPALAKFNIARGQSLEFVAFDPEAVKNGEPQVVWISAEGEEARDTNFDRFLRSHFAAMKRQLAAARRQSKPKTRPKVRTKARR